VDERPFDAASAAHALDVVTRVGGRGIPARTNLDELRTTFGY
jgi:hypothetical protein